MIARREQAVVPESREARLLAYFESAQEAFQRALARTNDSVTRTYSVAGLIVRFHFAGHALVSLLDTALAHLATDADLPADRTVYVWDRASTGVPLPPLRGLSHHDVSPQQLRGSAVPRIRTNYHGDYGALSMFDPDRSLALFSVPSADRLPVYERAAPVRTILHWCIESANVQLVHAGAVGTTDGGIVLAGKGGAGKSTTALTCLDHGLSYVGDDYVALSTAPTPVAWSLYATAKLNDDSLRRLPRLAETVSNPDRPSDDKALIFLAHRYSTQLVTGLPVKAIVLPQVTNAPDTELRPASRAAALVALAPGSIFYLPDAGASAFRAISSFVKSLPTFALRIGTNSANIPDLLADLARSA